MSSPPSFEQFNLNRQLLNAIDEMGFTTPTEIQVKAIPVMLGGQEVIGIAQTGTGKTAAYLLPLLMRIKFAQGDSPRALILAPTKELTLQIVDHAHRLAKYTDIRIMALYGGVGPKVQIETLEKGIDILVSTPLRFMELYLKGTLIAKQIKTLIIDEADRMMDMGFMPQLRKILEVIPQKRQNLLFSATFPEKVERLSAEFLTFPVRIEVTPQATTAEFVEQQLFAVPNLKTKILFLEHLLAKREEYSRVIIFTRTKDTANSITKYIERKELGPVRVVHSNKGQNTRINAVQEFKDGNLRILVSTDVAARGIDVEEVTHVINFDVPTRYEDYVHRIGRTGRAFHFGKAITFCTKAESYHLEQIEKIIRQKLPVLPLPPEIVPAETPRDESQTMAREVDWQRRREDPTFLGSFHKSKRRKRKTK